MACSGRWRDYSNCYVVRPIRHPASHSRTSARQLGKSIRYSDSFLQIPIRFAPFFNGVGLHHNRRYALSSPLCSPWWPPRSTYQAPTRQPGILRHWSDCVEQFASEHPNCTDTILHLRTCFKISVFLVVLYVVTISNPRVGFWRCIRRPCSDSDMLRRLIKCSLGVVTRLTAVQCPYDGYRSNI